MDESKIAVRYAKALFESAVDRKMSEKVMHDLFIINEILQFDDFQFLMQNPVVKTSEKIKILSRILKNRINELTLNFITIIIQNKREYYLDRIIRHFQFLYKSYKGIKSAELIVPVKIDKESINKFKGILTEICKCEIELSTKINPDIIGGFVLKIEDEQFDASVTSALRKMKESLV